MARQKQITAHLPAELLAKIDAACVEEAQAADRLTKTPGHHMPRNAMIVLLLERAFDRVVSDYKACANPRTTPDPRVETWDKVLP